MKDLQQVTANLEEIALLDQQILCDDMKTLEEIKTNVENIFSLSALVQEETFLGHVLGLDQKENKVSDILAFFLNPKEEHGYSDLFLTTLAECLSEKTDWTLNPENFKRTKREHPFKETGSQNKIRIDLVLYFTDLVLGIEHKIHAKLNNPLEKYLEGLQKIAKESKKEAKLIVFSLNKYSATELKGCINITYAEFYKTLSKNKENFQSNLRWQGVFEDFLISMESLIGVQDMSEGQKKRKSLIWNLFTKSNVKEIIEEYKSLKERFIALQEELTENYREKIENLGFKTTEFQFDESSEEDYKLMYNISFDTKKKTELTLCIENYGKALSVSLLYGGEEIINNDDEILTIENDPPYDDGWIDSNGDTLFWRKVLVNDKFLCKKIDSNPYADNFTEKVMAACEEILGTLAKALKY